MPAVRTRYFAWRRRALVPPAAAVVVLVVWALAPLGPIGFGGWLAAALVGSTGCAWASLAKATRRRATGAAALLAVTTLAFNTSIALLVVELIDARWPLTAAEWLQTLLILSGNVGAIFAGFRSAATRSETAATLHGLTELQVAATSVPIVEASVRAYQSHDMAVVVAELETMLRLAINLKLVPSEFTRGRLWARDDRNKEWFMCGASGLDMRQADFKLPVVERTESGAGVVPNLAVAALPGEELDGAWVEGDVFVSGAEVGKHRWFRSRTPESRPPAGLIAVVLRDGGEAIGALTLTSDVPVAIGPRDREEIGFVLRTWSWSFAVGIKELRWFLTMGSPDRKLGAEVPS
jgi:hypothetical protein